MAIVEQPPPRPRHPGQTRPGLLDGSWLLIGGGAVAVAVVAVAVLFVVLSGSVGKGTGTIHLHLDTSEARIHQVQLDAGEGLAVATQPGCRRLATAVMIDRNTKDRLDDRGYLTGQRRSQIVQASRRVLASVRGSADDVNGLDKGDPHVSVDGFDGYVLDPMLSGVFVAPVTGQYAVVFVNRSRRAETDVKAFLRTAKDSEVKGDLDRPDYRQLTNPLVKPFLRFQHRFTEDAKTKGFSVAACQIAG